MFLLLTLSIFATFSSVSIVDFGKITLRFSCGMKVKVNFIPKKNLKPIWVHFGSSYSQVEFILTLHPKVFLGKFGPKNWSSPNRLKFGVWVHCYILISNLMFIFSKFLSFIFFGQIWSQNLKVLKLNGIWYSGTLLYVYYNFNVHLSKIFVNHVFWANLEP